MPTIGVVAAIGASAASAASGIYGANKSSEANAAANATTSASNQAAIAEQQRQDAQSKSEFDAQQSAAKAQWDAEQQIRAPYRAAGQQALLRLGDLIGTHFDPSIIPSTQAYQPATYVGPSSNGPVTTPAPAPSPQTVKMGSMLPPPQGGTMSPGARQVVDPVTGQLKTVVN